MAKLDYEEAFGLDRETLRAAFVQKYGSPDSLSWSPELRARYDYLLPDDYYEAFVDSRVTPSTRWIDVGGGRDLFPNNRELASRLAARAAKVVGVDPDANIHDNPYIGEALQGMLGDYPGAEAFDLLTLRMVAEHVEDAEGLVADLDRLAAPGASVVILTPYLWSPMSIGARFTPMSVHHIFKRVLWDTEERDTFPVQFRMNTRADLYRLFEKSSFTPTHFRLLDDCSVLAKWKLLNQSELIIRRLLRTFGIPYPELVVMAVFTKKG